MIASVKYVETLENTHCPLYQPSSIVVAGL